MFRMTRPLLIVAALGLAAGVSTADAKTTTAKTPTTKSHKAKKNLAAEAKISETDARATAQAQVPDGTFKAEELEREGGKLIYSYEFTVPGKAGVMEVNINAMDGTVVNVEDESPAKEAKESKADHKKPTASPTPHR